MREQQGEERQGRGGGTKREARTEPGLCNSAKQVNDKRTEKQPESQRRGGLNGSHKLLQESNVVIV